MREMIVDGVQLVEETTTLSKLTLKEGGAKLTAPRGKICPAHCGRGGPSAGPPAPIRVRWCSPWRSATTCPPTA